MIKVLDTFAVNELIIVSQKKYDFTIYISCNTKQTKKKSIAYQNNIIGIMKMMSTTMAKTILHSKQFQLYHINNLLLST